MLETYVEQGGFGVSRLKIKVKYLIGDPEQAGLAFPALPPPFKKKKLLYTKTCIWIIFFLIIHLQNLNKK